MIEDYADVRHSNTYILWAIQYMLWNRPMSRVIGKHVYGHQDAEARSKNQLARMNDMAHNLATEYLEFCKVTNERAIRIIPTKMWTVSIGNKTITSNFERSILKHIYLKEMRQYRLSKGNIPPDLYEKNHWEVFGNATKSYTYRERIFSTKLCTGFLPTAGRMHLFDNKTSARCPCRGRMSETIEQILPCTNSLVLENRAKEIDKLETWLESNSTHPDITRTIINTLKDGIGAKFSDHVPEQATITLRQCAKEQDLLGMLNFYRGYLVQEWSMMQKEYFGSIFFTVERRRTDGWKTLSQK